VYKSNIQQLFQTFRQVLQPKTLFIWTTALPVAETVRGGVILSTINFLSDVLRYDVLLANDYASQAAAECGFNVLDLHFEMRRHIGLRMSDGIHWNALAHRKISLFVIKHICSAWHVILPARVSVSFGRLSAGPGSGAKKSTNSSEVPDGDEPQTAVRDLMSLRFASQAEREHGYADSSQHQAPYVSSGNRRNGALLPTPYV